MNSDNGEITDALFDSEETNFKPSLQIQHIRENLVQMQLNILETAAAFEKLNQIFDEFQQRWANNTTWQETINTLTSIIALQNQVVSANYPLTSAVINSTQFEELKREILAQQHEELQGIYISLQQLVESEQIMINQINYMLHDSQFKRSSLLKKFVNFWNRG